MNSDDIIRWPDDTWCYRDELPGYNHKSDDYEVILYASPAWHQFLKDHP